jgi:hypothetical protein
VTQLLVCGDRDRGNFIALLFFWSKVAEALSTNARRAAARCDMEASTLYHTADLLQLLALAVALTAAFIAGASYWRRTHASCSPSLRSGVPAGGIVYRDAPTIKVNESQRVDRIRKLVRLRVGESSDILATVEGLPPRFRVLLKGIAAADTAQISVEFGGTQVSCGPLVEETAFNEFTLPRAHRDEHRSSVFYYRERSDSLEFMRIRLKNADAVAGWAELDVMQLTGHWPGEISAEIYSSAA